MKKLLILMIMGFLLLCLGACQHNNTTAPDTLPQNQPEPVLQGPIWPTNTFFDGFPKATEQVDSVHANAEKTSCTIGIDSMSYEDCEQWVSRLKEAGVVFATDGEKKNDTVTFIGAKDNVNLIITWNDTDFADHRLIINFYQ